MEIQIDIPQDIALDEKRFKAVEQGILKAISKDVYQEGLAFQIQDVTFHYWKMIFGPLTLWPIGAIVLSLLIVMI